MRVTLMGHAGLYIEAGEERILVDPILRNTPIASGTVVYAIKRALSLERMPPPTLIIVTHAHLDHFDPESLNTQSRSTPLVCPNDPELVRSLSELGFHPIALNPWDRHRGRGVEMMATPSAAGIDEVGFVFESEGRRFWHMTDAEPTIADGSKIAAGGITDLVSVKYQPTAQIQGQVFRNLGASFDTRPVVEWLEAACAAQPALAFPYAS